MIAFVPIFVAFSGIAAPNTDYIAIDVRSRAVIAEQWNDAATAIPVGSLVKPFMALAYNREFPEFVCEGKASGCWLEHGHGRETFREAIAQSCNAYFLNLARGVNEETLRVTTAKFGIPAPAGNRAGDRIGLGEAWKISPVGLINAYAELVARRDDPRIVEILAGMKLAAKSGTARAIGGGVLAKTGTAPCVANRKHKGDGFTMVLAPADAPRVALLVRVHGTTGAETAKVASRILHELGVGR